MKDSPWFIKHKNIFRGMILLSLIITLLGPWFFDEINVPAEYPCSPPYVRLYGDFCGSPTSGIQMFGLFISILPLIPLLTTLLSIWKKETRRFLTINLVAWILALILALYIFIADFYKFQQIQHSGYMFRLWGIWFYIIVAACAIVYESTLIKRKTGAP